MIGTFAPSTMPAAFAPARKVRLFARTLPASRSGTTRILAREIYVLDLGSAIIDGVVQSEGAVEHGTRDPASVSHLAKRHDFDHGRHVSIHSFHRRENGDLHLRVCQA
jgi:hypothetical protein